MSDDFNKFLEGIHSCLNKNGIIILSTINRNFLSYFTTILIAEKILKLVPRWNS